MNNIRKTNNCYYLGDKPYDIYPEYVKNFDICIIPYVLEKYGHGADTIKAYEYISTNNKTVGTFSSGMEKLDEYMYICSDKESFSDCLNSTLNEKKRFHERSFEWSYKLQEMLDIF